jgi:hypothetical protein
MRTLEVSEGIGAVKMERPRPLQCRIVATNYSAKAPANPVAWVARHRFNRRMRLWFVTMLVVPLVGGCVSKSKARLREQEAFVKGQREILSAQQQAQQPTVLFRGLIRRPRVPWSEGLTLAQGILAADYTGSGNPGRIRIIRQGQIYPIDVKLLLRGKEDPLLEAGDIVEISP